MRKLNSRRMTKCLIWIWNRILSSLKVKLPKSDSPNFISSIQNVCRTEAEDDVMKHPHAETLDICMVMLFDFIKKEYDKENKKAPISKTFQLLIHCFEKLILPVHNSHHVQFMLFYFCSFKVNKSIGLKFGIYFFALLILVF